MATQRLSPASARARLTELRGIEYTEPLTDQDVLALAAALDLGHTSCIPGGDA